MRRIITFLLFSGFLLCGSAGLRAEGLGVFGSYWDPADGDETLGAGVRLRGGDGPFYYLLRGTYFDDITEDDRELFRIELQTIPVDLGFGLQAHADENLTLYGGGGVTYYFLDSDNFGDVDDEIGWYLEAGTEFGISEDVGLFIEGVWRRVEGQVDDDDDVRFGDTDIDLEGFSLNLGLIFHW